MRFAQCDDELDCTQQQQQQQQPKMAILFTCFFIYFHLGSSYLIAEIVARVMANQVEFKTGQ